MTDLCYSSICLGTRMAPSEAERSHPNRLDELSSTGSLVGVLLTNTGYGRIQVDNVTSLASPSPGIP